MSSIAILGSGNVGTALAGSLVRAGHSVTIASRDPERATAAASVSGATAAQTYRAAALAAETIIMAVPFSAVESVAAEIAPVVAGKTIVDATNALKSGNGGTLFNGTDSAAETLARWLPASHVVKAFNTAFARVMADPTVDGEPADGFVAGDDAEAKATTLAIVDSIGFRAVDAGPLVRARELETLAWFNIALQSSLGNAWGTAWKLMGVPSGVLESVDAVDATRR